MHVVNVYNTCVLYFYSPLPEYIMPVFLTEVQLQTWNVDLLAHMLHTSVRCTWNVYLLTHMVMLHSPVVPIR